MSTEDDVCFFFSEWHLAADDSISDEQFWRETVAVAQFITLTLTF